MRTSRHLEQVLAHAASRLAATGTRRPTEVLPLYKKFLKVEEHRLRLKHQAGGGGREICARRAELVDVLLQYVFGAAATAEANRDMRTKTAMLESRFLAGDAELARQFRGQFRSKCVRGYEREYVEMRMRDQAARHKKFGDSVYLQEPNLKNGCGGLRDYQNLLWMTYFKEGSLSTNQLVGKDWLSESDQRRIEKAYDF